MLISNITRGRNIMIFILLFILIIIVFSNNSFATTNTTETLNNIQTTTSAGTIMTVKSDAYTYGYKENITVTIGIENPNNYYAEDFSILYEADAFEYLDDSLKTFDSEKLSIINADTTTSGVVRVIIASNDLKYAISDNQDILTLKLKSKSIDFSGNICISTISVVDDNGIKYNVDGSSKIFQIKSKTNCDVNSDGNISLSDLGVASRFLGTSNHHWGGNHPDINNNNTVDIDDLNKIGMKLIK